MGTRTKPKEPNATRRKTAFGWSSQSTELTTKHPIRPRVPNRFMTPLAVLPLLRPLDAGNQPKKGRPAGPESEFLPPESAPQPESVPWGSPNKRRTPPKTPGDFGLPRQTGGTPNPK